MHAENQTGSLALMKLQPSSEELIINATGCKMECSQICLWLLHWLFFIWSTFISGTKILRGTLTKHRSLGGCHLNKSTNKIKFEKEGNLREAVLWFSDTERVFIQKWVGTNFVELWKGGSGPLSVTSWEAALAWNRVAPQGITLLRKHHIAHVLSMDSASESPTW